MNRRSQEAQQNLSHWNDLLSEAKNLVSRASDLHGDVEQSKRNIDDAWDETSSEVVETGRNVATIIEEQASDRQADAKFDLDDASDPPPPAPPEDPVHGDVDLSDQVEFEISDPVRVSELRSDLDAVEEQPPEERERPEPYTEREWFRRHSDQFPIGEDIFTVEALEHDYETADEAPDERAVESDEEPAERSEESDTRDRHRGTDDEYRGGSR
jgi:hypothetical protein